MDIVLAWISGLMPFCLVVTLLFHIFLKELDVLECFALALMLYLGIITWIDTILWFLNILTGEPEIVFFFFIPCAILFDIILAKNISIEVKRRDENEG